MINKTSGKKPRICAIYVRVSKDEQHPDHQINALKSHSSQQNYRVFKIYRDEITGKSSSRPALNEMMFDARKGRFDVVLCWKLDRLGRSLKHLINIAEEWYKLGIDFVCISQNIDTTTASGKLTFHILGAVAEFEHSLISERTKLGQKNAKNIGKRGKDKKVRNKSGYYRRWEKQGKKMGG